MHYTIISYEPDLKALAQRLRNNMALGEVILWNHLKSKQIYRCNFDRQIPINQFIIDLYCKKLRLAVAIDGSSHDCHTLEKIQQDGEQQAHLESVSVRFFHGRHRRRRDRAHEMLAVLEAWAVRNAIYL